MSTLKVNTIQNTSSVEMYLAKAWVNFNGTGTVAIRASGNVSSITDNGTGIYTINFTTALSDANYSLVGTCGVGGGHFVYIGQTWNAADSQSSLTTTSAAIRTGLETDVPVDTSPICVTIFR